MAQLTGTKQAFNSDTSIVDTSQEEILGSRGMDASGNEYAYLQGIGSSVSGDWVVYDEDYLVTRLVADEVGAVAIAMATIVASSFGWYQIYGVNTIARTDTVAADSSLYIDGTAGRVDDLGVAGDLVIGAYSMTADTSNVATVFILYPSVSNDIGGAGGTLTAETPTGDVNDSNTSFTVLNVPLYIVVNGQQYAVGEGQYSSLSTLTISLANPVGKNGFITSWFLA